MKFLQHDGDSVVSLRFLYQEMPSGDYEQTEAVDDKLTFDTVGEIQDAMADLFENGEAPFNLQERVLDLDAIRAEGDYTESEMRAQIQQFQTDLYITLNNEGNQDQVPDFIDALREFMNQADDLSEFRDEEADLRGEVEHYAERIDASADIRNEMAELAGDITGRSLERDARLSENGERTPDRPVVTVASRAEELPSTLNAAVASVESDIAERFGESSLAGFDPDLYA